MFEFPRFAVHDPRHANDLVRSNPFALVVSGRGGVPVATHAPVLPEGQVEGSFAGTTLLGHMARVNPHWRQWEGDATEVLVVFSGPHGYVSPSMHGAAEPSVPTWNYGAVHLTGRLELILGEEEMLDVVERTVQAMETPRTPKWEPGAASRDVFRQIVGGVVAFRVHVRDEAKLFKVSQDADDRTHGHIRDAFAGPEGNAGLAHLMDVVDPRGES
ncbi:FMN-binding negative transcriptional regulator [Spirillospora sp. CA-128828]|uniref:FMN-binding negative transcriptional regulator n=1 Tax=Spirillospora sp. CA-128828 TaxID=3240033 RepID=UPI003D93763A